MANGKAFVAFDLSDPIYRLVSPRGALTKQGKGWGDKGLETLGFQLTYKYGSRISLSVCPCSAYPLIRAVLVPVPLLRSSPSTERRGRWSIDA